MRPLEAVDLFCGAGGTSSGILKAAGKRLIKLTAVNHWQTAINTHSLNHPGVRHLCEPVENIHPLDAVKSGRLDLLAASCECRFHSNARGGGVCNEQSRSQAWQLIRWMTDLDVRNLLMENVREFMNWGPIHSRTKRPIKSRKGEFFRAFIRAVESLGYNVEFKVQVAANFGDATSRQRLMIMACKGRPVPWPEPTHGPGRAQPWRTAREIIDRSIESRSIFNEDGKPRHCKNTVDRMKAGIIKFGGENAGAFLIMLNGTTDAHLRASAVSLDEPLPTVTCSNRMMLVEPQAFILQTDQTGGNSDYVRSLDRPLPTVVTKQNMLLIEPMILKYYKTGRCKSVDQPLDTVTTKARFLLVEFDGDGEAACDIRARLLKPHELGAAHSFPSTYQFTGNIEDQTKQIGNSVPVELACAHARVLL